ncbi:MAG: thiolase C-terminal domain-containing protein, partial [Thermoplasmatota archaeon]
AGQAALKRAKVGVDDIDFFEVHDCFTIAEVAASEDLGLFKRGTGAKAATDGLTKIGGKRVINPSGGLKAKGHPVGATGVGQIVEVYEQLLGEAGGRQVDGAMRGLTHNVGATGGTVVVNVLSRRT